MSDKYKTYNNGRQTVIVPTEIIPDELSFWSINTNKNSMSKSSYPINTDIGYYPYGLDNTLNQNNIDRIFAQRQQELDILNSASNTKQGLDIYNTAIGSLTGLTNFGLGIWNAIENNKNLQKQRDVADKQIALAQEQITASQEYRQQRKDEIDRLNRVRSKTSKAFNTGSVITRSY